MKAAKVFAMVFAVLGLVLMLGTAGLCFASLDAPVKLKNMEYAQDCAREVMEAIADGDFDAASELLYYHPDLGTGRTLTGEAAAVWEIFKNGISYEFTSACYAVSNHIYMDAVVTVPDIASITDSLESHARSLLNDRISAATEMSELYDDAHNFRQELIDEVMARAVELALAETPEKLSFETTLELVREGKQWYVAPDRALLNALTGGLA